MKSILVRFRGVWIVAISLIFNLISSLLVWHPPGIQFNIAPMTITE